MKLRNLFRYCLRLVLDSLRRWLQQVLKTLALWEMMVDAQNIEKGVLSSNSFDLHIDNNETSGISSMSERLNLLVSLEEIMLKSFPTLQDSDTLSSAYAVFVLRDLKEIVVLDNSENFSGIARATALYSKMPSSVLDMPYQLRDRSDDADKLLSHLILEVGRRKINEELLLDKPNRLFQTVEPLSNLLSEINSLYNYYLYPKTIPVFDRSKAIRGIITYRGILKYLRQDSILKEATVEDLCSSKCLKEYVSILTPDDYLAVAAMLMEYTLTDHVVVANGDQKAIGYMDRLWISKLIHYSHFELINAPLRDLARPPNGALKFVALNERLANVIQYLVESDVKILVNQESSDCNSNIRLITPLTIVNFFLASF